MKRSILFLSLVSMFASPALLAEVKAKLVSQVKPGWSIELPFSLHSHDGIVKVTVLIDENPKSWGYDTILGRGVPLNGMKGFPICTATVTYRGKGYNGVMGWIQVLTYRNESTGDPTVLIDRTPQFEGVKSPFVYWGYVPTFFDAPSMLTKDGLPKKGVAWRAESFLVASPDGLMSKTVFPLLSFSWGYRTSQTGDIEVLKPENSKLKGWKRAMEVLRKEYPAWTFQD